MRFFVAATWPSCVAVVFSHTMRVPCLSCAIDSDFHSSNRHPEGLLNGLLYSVGAAAGWGEKAVGKGLRFEERDVFWRQRRGLKQFSRPK